MTTYLTNSERACYRKCPRMHYYQYEKRRISKQTREPFVFGSAIGLAMDCIWNNEPEHIQQFADYISKHAREDRKEVLYYKGVAMIKGYLARYPNLHDEWELLKTEHTVKVDMGNDVIFTGQLDKVARNRSTGRLCVIDHKTSKEDIDDLASEYWESINYIDPQTTGYAFALSQEFDEEVDVYYDVMKKEGSKGPKMKTVVRKRKDESQDDFEIRKADNIESFEEYGARLTELYIENPEFYQMQQVVKTQGDTQEWKEEFLADASSIQHAIDMGVHPKVTYACGRRDLRCEYITVCAKINSIDGDDFVTKEKRHPELND